MEKERTAKKSYRWVIILLLLDQITKTLMTGKTLFQTSTLSLTYMENTGSAFGLFSGFQFYPQVITVLSIITIYFLIKYKKEFWKTKILQWAHIFMIAGIASNMIDRIVYGFVKDFISISFFSTFNFADIYLTVAAVLLIVHMSRDTKNLKKQNPES
ncbi:MAG: signal peptidase II [Nanoarchaeota archaeon]